VMDKLFEIAVVVAYLLMLLAIGYVLLGLG